MKVNKYTMIMLGIFFSQHAMISALLMGNNAANQTEGQAQINQPSLDLFKFLEEIKESDFNVPAKTEDDEVKAAKGLKPVWNRRKQWTEMLSQMFNKLGEGLKAASMQYAKNAQDWFDDKDQKIPAEMQKDINKVDDMLRESKFLIKGIFDKMNKIYRKLKAKS